MVDEERAGSVLRSLPRPSFDCIVLLLQGGGALGAYQAGAYQALAEADLHPNWVAGISIGAINAAIIAGNPPAERVTKLRAFWEGATANPLLQSTAELGGVFLKDGVPRKYFNELSAMLSLSAGVPGVFLPRAVPAWLSPSGSPEAISYYDTRPLRSTLETLVDFDRINEGDTRLSVGAVNVTSGNFVYFDRTTHRITPDHVLASGALPPGLPPVEIDGAHYWDGGLVSNTPLQWVLECGPRQDTLAFEVDLWSARGRFPRNLAEVNTRQKEIQYSSRTRENTDQFRTIQHVRCLAAQILEKLPDDVKESREARELQKFADGKVYRIVHLIYRTHGYEGDSKDYEFSRHSMEDHWRAGYEDTIRTLHHPEALSWPPLHEGVATFDIAAAGGR